MPPHRPRPSVPDGMPSTRIASRFLAPIFIDLVTLISKGVAPQSWPPTRSPFSHTLARSATAPKQRRTVCPRQEAGGSTSRKYQPTAGPPAGQVDGTATGFASEGGDFGQPAVSPVPSGSGQKRQASSMITVSRPLRAGAAVGRFFGGGAACPGAGVAAKSGRVAARRRPSSRRSDRFRGTWDIFAPSLAISPVQSDSPRD